MKTTLQKMICLSICVTMLLVLFAGCGKEPVSNRVNPIHRLIQNQLDELYAPLY